jgi:hypothetical protein
MITYENVQSMKQSVALITGANTGIGRITALTLAGRGYQLILAYQQCRCGWAQGANEAVLRDGLWRESSWTLSAHPRSLKPDTKPLTFSNHSYSKPCSLDGTHDSLGKSPKSDKIADRYFGIRDLQALQYSLYQIDCAALKAHRDQLLCPSPRKDCRFS